MKTNFIERIDEINYQQYLDNGVVVITDTLVEKINFTGYNFSEKNYPQGSRKGKIA